MTMNPAASVQDDVSCLLYGGRRGLKRIEGIRHFIEVDNAHLFDRSMRPYDNPTSRYTKACEKVMHFRNLMAMKGVRSLDEIYDYYLCVDENLPLDVHLSMFIPSLMYHTSPSQKRVWLPAALEFKILGTYAQTELSHGSNVRGIQTSAVFDSSTNEFVITTPTLEAYKWWPGGLALTATHAVVIANLIVPWSNENRSHNSKWVVDKKDTRKDTDKIALNLGPHAFFVQIRSTKDHQLMPNVTTGVIGPKMGYHSMDNGYAKFDSVRIPRTHMLMGYASVDRLGRYFKRPDSNKIAFGIMLDVRTRICRFSSFALAKALTIALRYSLFRKQGYTTIVPNSNSNNIKKGNDNNGNNDDKVFEAYSRVELSVIDYSLQRKLLYPLLSLCFAIHFLGRRVSHQYRVYISKTSGVVSDNEGVDVYTDHIGSRSYNSDSNSSMYSSSHGSTIRSSVGQNHVADSGSDRGSLEELEERESLSGGKVVCINDEWPLDALHASTASIKAFVTDMVSAGLETCRRACGGHGFLQSAGFSEIILSYLPANTYEGTKEVLSQQAGRYLLKKYLGVKFGHNNNNNNNFNSRLNCSGPLYDVITKENLYLLSIVGDEDAYSVEIRRRRLSYKRLQTNQISVDNGSKSLSDICCFIADVVKAFELRCIWAVSIAADVYIATRNDNNSKTGSSKSSKVVDPLSNPLGRIHIELFNSSKAFTEMLLVKEFGNTIQLLIQSSNSEYLSASRWLLVLFNILVVGMIEANLSTFVLANIVHRSKEGSLSMASITTEESFLGAFSYVTDNGAALKINYDTSIPDLLNALLVNLQPEDSICLIESFKLSDFCLNSTIGGKHTSSSLSSSSSMVVNNDSNISGISSKGPYEKLFEDTLKDPLNTYRDSDANDGEVSEGYSRYLSKVIDKSWTSEALKDVTKSDFHTSKL